MVVFINRVILKCTFLFRNAVFRKSVSECGKNSKVRGRFILLNNDVKISDNVTFFDGVQIFGDGPIRIGNNVSIGNNTIIYASKDGGGVKVGNNTQIAAHCYIIDANHGVASDRLVRLQPNTVSPIIIGNDVWIAASSTILKGSLIRDGAIIGANSVVNGEIEEYGIAVGSPAKVIKKRE